MASDPEQGRFDRIDPAWLDGVTPVVLVGGRSERFGRDKLREAVDRGGQDSDGLLIDRSVLALRDVFGRRVLCVGRCHPDVRGRFDGEIADPYPGLGPMGGILAALEGSPGAVFVLAGDLIGIEGRCVREILAWACADGEIDAVIAHAGRDHPTIGVYRQSIRDAMRVALERGELGMHRFLRTRAVDRVRIDDVCARNVNRPGDLRGV